MRAPNVLFTVAICTWNRCALLGKTLEQLAALDGSLPNWEVLVVDNACTDATASVASSFVGRLPLRLVHEATPGLSRARNRAVAEARGQFIAWTDDDVLVSPQWLNAYAGAIARYPSADFFGGPIRPWFETQPPEWLSANWHVIGEAYATRDFRSEEFALDELHMPFGANYVVRRESQRQFAYDPKLGRVQGSLLGGEEVGVLTAMMRAGHVGWWVPEASVTHMISSDRLTASYLRRFYAKQGVVQSSDAETAVPQLLGRPRWLWRRALMAEASYRVARVTKPSRDWVPKLIASSVAWGRARGK